MNKEQTLSVEQQNFIQRLKDFNNGEIEFVAKGYKELYYTILPKEFTADYNYYVFRRYFDGNGFKLIKPHTLVNPYLTNTNRTSSNRNKTTTEIKVPLKIIANDLKIEDVRMEDFQPFKTNKGIDMIFSMNGGIMPGTSTVLIGDPGAGKTTNGVQMLADIRTNYPEVELAVLSSEMKLIDVQEELIKNPWYSKVPHILFSDYKKSEYLELFKAVLNHGYDLLLIDSLADIIEKVVTESNYNKTEAYNWIMDSIQDACDGKTTTGKKTAVLIIQQVNKSGEFSGKNNLKHNTTAMLHFCINEDTNERYCYFSKNRRRGDYIGKRLFLDKDEVSKEIVYDIERFENDRKTDKIIRSNKKTREEQKQNFDDVFLNNNTQFENDNENDNENGLIETTEYKGIPMFLDEVEELEYED